MPQSIPPGLTRAHVLLALADIDGGEVPPFGTPTGYELVHAGGRYAPKAVIGLAHRHLTGHLLPHDRFSGGNGPGQANAVLRQLGFTIVAKGEAVAKGEKTPRRDWTEREVAAVVADYFAMLRKELFGEPYSKTEHRAALRRLLDDRSDGSVEYKHQNISAVLAALGIPYLPGYKPAGNYQALLARGVEAYLAHHPEYLVTLAESPAMSGPVATPAVPSDPMTLFEDAPEWLPPPSAVLKPWLTQAGRRIDFSRLDVENRALGRQGEEFVVELERARLKKDGRDDLARQVDWVADTIGDGLGYDVRSFEPADAAELFVEVKTTRRGKYHPFHVTATELACSEDVPKKFRLYRVFAFGPEAKLYRLRGSLSQNCHLTATRFLARARAETAAGSGDEEVDG